jgi:ABC-type polysaccharide/polyol phosphate transport system ATPase subunit
MTEQPIIIRVENVSKRYRRTTYRPSLRNEAMALLRQIRRQNQTTDNQPFWALKDINFTVKRGESVGIVGRNGSGKTTLLRLLSGIMKPTAGQIMVDGRFASLIGLSAGFLTELSGRKNIYLNAALQGMSPRKVDDLVETIIDFAEIRPFIDTPVKHYSSGMGARLGFSIAIHILPEIVFLDEVLAVGDAEFQQKCINRMLQLKADGRTFLFVSHGADSVKKLCERTIWLNYGTMIADGPSEEILDAYARSALPDESPLVSQA